jgi:hypothetical protein
MTLNHASHFRRKRGVIENFEYLGEFEEYFQKCWVYFVLYLLVTETCKKSLKDYENLVHVYLKGAGTPQHVLKDNTGQIHSGFRKKF